MSSTLFNLDNENRPGHRASAAAAGDPQQRPSMFAFDDEDDALFAEVPMPDLDDPAVTGVLSFGADSGAPSTVPKQPQRRQQEQPASSWQPSINHQFSASTAASSSNDDAISPVAQSTQIPHHQLQQQQQQMPRQKPSSSASSHRRTSAGKFPGPAGRLPRLRIPPDAVRGGGGAGGRGVANAFAEAARQLTASASAAAAASKREERAAAAAAATVASSSQASTTSNASSSSALDEETASWSAAAADLGPGLCRYLSRYSVAESLKLAASGRLPRNKVPAMLLIVETMDPSSVDGVASIKDSTGRLQATLHRQVIRDLRDKIQPGAALVLRRVTLFSPDQRSYYLNITMDNIVRVYDRCGAPLPAGSTTTSSLSPPTRSTMLNDEEVRRLEAECLRPKSPLPSPTVQHQPQQQQQQRRWSSVDQQQGQRFPPPKRASDSRFVVASASTSASLSASSSSNSATPAKRFRFAPVGQQPQQQQHHRYNSYPQQHPQQHPQPHHQYHSNHRHPNPQSRQQQQQQAQSRDANTRVLQEAYRDAFDDNMDELLASALDDI